MHSLQRLPDDLRMDQKQIRIGLRRGRRLANSLEMVAYKIVGGAYCYLRRKALYLPGFAIRQNSSIRIQNKILVRQQLIALVPNNANLVGKIIIRPIEQFNRFRQRRQHPILNLLPQNLSRQNHQNPILHRMDFVYVPEQKTIKNQKNVQKSHLQQRKTQRQRTLNTNQQRRNFGTTSPLHL